MLALLLLLPLTRAAPTFVSPQQRQDIPPTPETWAIRGFSRSCSESDSVCQFHFTIDTGAPLPGDPMPVPTYSTNIRSAILTTLNTVTITPHKNHDNNALDDTTTTTTTTCDHMVAASPSTPASRGTSLLPTQCGAFQITSSWSHILSNGTAVTGAQAADVDGAIGHGFTVLSVVDANRKVLIYPSASDEEITSANAAAAAAEGDGGVGELEDRRYLVVSIP